MDVVGCLKTRQVFNLPPSTSFFYILWQICCKCCTSASKHFYWGGQLKLWLTHKVKYQWLVYINLEENETVFCLSLNTGSSSTGPSSFLLAGVRETVQVWARWLRQPLVGRWHQNFLRAVLARVTNCESWCVLVLMSLWRIAHLLRDNSQEAGLGCAGEQRHGLPGNH